MCHDNVGRDGNVVPRSSLVVGECPETASRGVRRAEDSEFGAGSARGGESDGGAGVIEVGDGWRGREKGETVGMGLGVLIMELRAMLGAESFVEADVMITSYDNLGLELGALEPLDSAGELLICVSSDEVGDAWLRLLPRCSSLDL